MKPVVSPFKAYFCTVVSAFGIVILTVLGYLFYTGHESMMGSTSDPENGKEVAKTLWTTAVVYLGFLLFCGFQIVVINKNNSVQLH
ncbi:uncharacterized protein ASCRUDRAFT_75897 [Ascoidea rubescens DSM 1968]|uniref:Uncharacterized protein n=1 Tax=Ascoidea rubescens DSM 1968 TaxID=1344418 RepID=A0A1D2VHR1_9ASCO|nr:hypothetical protein ASCRUDRAFT_75897 [Ascoidea rubescens DSM 1968]ODV61186.1 hypothetical protein ASCRUDRAFT_75897 [Ascoidea rubescens DSM 1968]